jgi:epoxyqueuosine reductase
MEENLWSCRNRRVESQERATAVKEHALELGFCAVGITDLGRNAHEEFLCKWLSSGMAGTMTYMHRQATRRIEPSKILAGADRAIVVLRNYFNDDAEREADTGLIAKYARGPDYHDTLQAPLHDLADHVRHLGGCGTIARVYVDAGPVPERELAFQAGLGWIGRNAMLIHPKHGSFHFIAVILTNLDMCVDKPFPHDRCGSCKRCIEACPTGAITQERMVDSRLCLSYLTIEYAGEIADALRRKMGDRIFGCDECQDVCPWNLKFCVRANDPVLLLDVANSGESLTALLEMSPDTFRKRFGHTPLSRAGPKGLKRNARIAKANVSDR